MIVSQVREREVWVLMVGEVEEGEAREVKRGKVRKSEIKCGDRK